jgi:hypothetical protein
MVGAEVRKTALFSLKQYTYDMILSINSFISERELRACNNAQNRGEHNREGRVQKMAFETRRKTSRYGSPIEIPLIRNVSHSE